MTRETLIAKSLSNSIPEMFSWVQYYKGDLTDDDIRYILQKHYGNKPLSELWDDFVQGTLD